jgi:hypothetical protein
MKKYIFLGVALLGLMIPAVKAAHIIGGDVIYRCISMNEADKTTTFAVSFTMYRDVLGGGANYDLNAQFGVYRENPNTGNWVFVQSITSNPTNIGNVALNDPCVSVPPNIRVERGSYHFNVTLPWDGNKYQIAYQRCCRNNSINNIVNPASTGAVFFVEIHPPAIRNCNNSPVFKKFPPVIICNNRTLHFDHGITDMEGDSVVYEFCTPLTSGGMLPGDDCNSIIPAPFKCLPPYPGVTFIPPFSTQVPMGGNPVVNINPETGLITGTPNLTGQYVVGICIKEYRNGELLTVTRRDFQFNVLECKEITFSQNFNLCRNDSLVINETVYTKGGIYTQNFVTDDGCDSIIVLNIKELPSSVEEKSASVCFGEGYEFFGSTLYFSGTYTKKLINSFGCDSTIILHLTVNLPYENLVQYSICDGEMVEVNGQIYNESGTYYQNLMTVSGCDSLLIIVVKKGVTTRENKHFYLCMASSFVVNGILYNLPGEYEQIRRTETGCDSILVISVYPCDQNVTYDFELCNALTPEQSMNYSEFVPGYQKMLSCGNIVAKNIHRELPQENKHSCTQGQESNLSMCVSASTDCDITKAGAKPIVLTFIADPAEGSFIKWNHLVFYHNSPAQYSWINGASGLNNRPTRFGYVIYKNSLRIAENTNVSTGNGWEREQINFFENPEMLLGKGDTIRIEWLPYCAVGNASQVSVWDMDNISLYFSCETKDNRIIGGNLVNPAAEFSHGIIRRKSQERVLETGVENGHFVFHRNDPFSKYSFTGYSDKNPSDGVSTFDLVLIQKHILGITPFENPLQFVAADINKDSRINTTDLIELRKIILGIKETFPNNHSWRFIPADRLHSTVHPLYWQDKIDIEPGYEDVLHLEFVPVKIGDIDGIPLRLKE